MLSAHLNGKDNISSEKWGKHAKIKQNKSQAKYECLMPTNSAGTDDISCKNPKKHY